LIADHASAHHVGGIGIEHEHISPDNSVERPIKGYLVRLADTERHVA
jgi:hypothetical protein